IRLVQQIRDQPFAVSTYRRILLFQLGLIGFQVLRSLEIRWVVFIGKVFIEGFPYYKLVGLALATKGIRRGCSGRRRLWRERSCKLYGPRRRIFRDKVCYLTILCRKGEAPNVSNARFLPHTNAPKKGTVKLTESR